MKDYFKAKLPDLSSNLAKFVKNRLFLVGGH